MGQTLVRHRTLTRQPGNEVYIANERGDARNKQMHALGISIGIEMRMNDTEVGIDGSRQSSSFH